MPATTAANLDDAILYARQNIQFLQATLGTRIRTWMTAAFGGASPIFNDGQQSMHRLTNWHIPTRRAADLVATPPSQVDVDRCTDAVYRFLNVVRDCVNEGVVSVAQGTAVVAAFNTAWT